MRTLTDFSSTTPNLQYLTVWVAQRFDKNFFHVVTYASSISPLRHASATGKSVSNRGAIGFS
jgi:hypothetical protein